MFTDSKTPSNFFRRDNKTLTEVRRQKNRLRTKAFRKNATDDDRNRFYESLRIYDLLKKNHDANEQRRNTAYEERKYKSDFWTFSKKAVNDSIYETQKYPTFTKDQADAFFTQRYETPITIDHTKLSKLMKISF